MFLTKDMTDEFRQKFQADGQKKVAQHATVKNGIHASSQNVEAIVKTHPFIPLIWNMERWQTKNNLGDVGCLLR